MIAEVCYVVVQSLIHAIRQSVLKKSVDMRLSYVKVEVLTKLRQLHYFRNLASNLANAEVFRHEFAETP